MDLNVSQTSLIPEVNEKDLEDEQKINHHDYAHSQDVDFGAWRDRMISQGHEEWTQWDKMTCNHADPHKK